MSHTHRIGSQIGPYDPFWVQVREAVSQKAQQLGIELTLIEIAGRPETLSSEEQIGVIEELLVQELDALICWNIPERMILQILEGGVPAIYLSESEIRHPLFVSPRGLYDAGRMIGDYFARQLNGRGNVLCVGGLSEPGGEDGSSRVAGFQDALSSFPEISVTRIPAYWRYEQALPQIEAAFRQISPPIHAIFGLSDSIALAARDSLRAMDWTDVHPLIAGVNGDPLALVAIAEGSLSATIETSALDFGGQAVELAYQAARGEPLPEHFSYRPHLVTAANLTEVALRKLVAIAELPTRLVGVNRQQEQNRLTQLETSAAINHRVGALLDRQRLAQEIANLIRDNYGYDHVQLFLWSQEEKAFILERSSSSEDFEDKPAIPLERSGILGEALQRNEPIFIPDTRYSHRFPPDPEWPETLSRVVLPIRYGETILGLLDLHSQQTTPHLSRELIGLQSLADQLGIAIRNAELYASEVQARAVAEKANQLKTRLLANVGHELRAPLNVILGYSQSALSQPNPYQTELPDGLRRDIGTILRSSEHLTRLINDLLDLSRAEINELDLFPEAIPTRAFLDDVYRTLAGTSPGEVAWRLRLPDQLPVIQADPVRLRQILLNLLSNARKFTSHGEIVLGAEVEPPHLHLWVQDTGLGVPVDLQERIFEPFVSIERQGHRGEGIGLGLSITRRLVALHGGMMTLESQSGQGSTFHVYLPLPSLSGKFSAPAMGTTGASKPVMLLISSRQEISPSILSITTRMGIPIRKVNSTVQVEALLKETTPCILAWDMLHASQNEWELVEQLHRHPQICQLPFIVYRQEAEDLEMTDVLVKPVSTETLFDAISALRPSQKRGSIIIADDDPEARELYQRLVMEAMPGFPVVCAENGAEALDLMQKDPPCLVILDLVMPEIDGFAVLQKMRALPETRQVPVLVMSGKLLSMDDIQRLNYFNVTFQNKEILSDEEVVDILQKIINPQDRLPQSTSILVKKAIAFLHQNYALPLTRQEIARSIGVSSNYLNHIFHEEVGLSPVDCLNRFRMLKAREILQHSSDSITTIAAQVGFDDPSYFSRVFRKYVGQTPQSYRIVGK